MEVSRDGQICAIFGKGDLFGANPKSEKAERSSANVRALRKMLKLTTLNVHLSCTFHFGVHLSWAFFGNLSAT